MRIVKLYSVSCMPCKVLDKNLKECGITYEECNIESDEGLDLCSMYGVRSVPTLLIINDEGQLVAKHSGMMTSEQLTDWINTNK